MGTFDDMFSPTDGSWSAFGMGGKGHPGSLGSWDVIGNGLDRANPAQGVDTGADQANAKGYIDKASGAYEGMTAPNFDKVNLSGPMRTPDATSTNAGPSDFNNINVNPEYNAAQSAQMAALSNIAARGGRSAASDANLAKIQQDENTNARGQRDAILQNANARGQGGSGAALLAQLSSSQNATNNQSARDMDVAGQEANTAVQAGQGAASIGAGMQQQAYSQAANRAAANDAINKFNAGQTTSVNEFNTGKNQGVENAAAQAQNQGQMVNNVEIPQQTFQDSMGIKAGQQAGAKAGLDYWQNAYNTDEKTKGNVLGAGIQGVSSIFGAAFGGKTPGHAPVAGNSTLNDIVPIMSSPGEVHVPPSLVHSGSPTQIGQYVKHAPTLTHSPAQNKEAMLSALKNISGRRRAA